MSTPLPSGILKALRATSGTSAAGPGASDGRTFQEISLDFTVPHESQAGVLTNKYNLLCPRGCRSVMLKRGVGQLVERSGIEMDPPGRPIDPALDPLSAPPATVQWWLVTPSPMEFENIGFSRPVVRSIGTTSTTDATDVTAASKPVKFLICADCDVGPLGWCEEGGKEFWLACSRVKYAVPRT